MMKKLLILTILCFGIQGAGAQDLVIGEKVDIKAVYLDASRPEGGKPIMLEFFVSRVPGAPERVKALDKLASDYSGRMSVVLVTREPQGAVESTFKGKGYSFYVALDDNDRTFKDFGVRYVPYAVLLDSKGRVAWFGNPSTLDDRAITDALGL